MDMAKTNKVNVNNTGNKMMSLDKSNACKIVFLRALIILVVDIIVASLFDFVQSEATRYYVFHMSVQTPLIIAFGILTVAAVGYLVVTYIKKLDTSAHYATPAMIVASALYILGTTVFFDRFATTPFLFYTITVIVSVLFVVYYIYTILLYKK